MRVHLIRHGQSANNALPEYQRIEDPALTPMGREQAERLGNWASQTPLAPLAADGRPIRSRRGDAVRTLLVPRGVHNYKFIVDGRWRPAPQDPVARDQAVRGVWF